MKVPYDSLVAAIFLNFSLYNSATIRDNFQIDLQESSLSSYQRSSMPKPWNIQLKIRSSVTVSLQPLIRFILSLASSVSERKFDSKFKTKQIAKQIYDISLRLGPVFRYCEVLKAVSILHFWKWKCWDFQKTSWKALIVFLHNMVVDIFFPQLRLFFFFFFTIKEVLISVAKIKRDIHKLFCI